MGLRSAVNTLPAVLTVPEVARELRIGKNAAYRLIQSGQLRHVNIGRAIRVPALRWTGS
jgi:excisionase family DNA binding protein